MATLQRGPTADDPELLSGGLAAAINSQLSAENHSGSLCAMSVTEDTSNLTFVPLVSSNNMVGLHLKQPVAFWTCLLLAQSSRSTGCLDTVALLSMVVRSPQRWSLWVQRVRM